MGEGRIDVETGSVETAAQGLRRTAERISGAVGSARHPVANGIVATGDAGANDGIRGMRFVRAAVESSKAGATWVEV